MEPAMLSTAVEREVWIARYLAGKLSDAETARFEAYWATHPEIIGDLEASARLKSGLRDLRARGELGGAMRDRWWSRRLSLLAMAATMAAVAAGVVAWRMATHVELVPVAPTIAALAPHASSPLRKGATYSLLRLRSSSLSDATVDLPVAPQAIELRVLPEYAAADGRYVVGLAPLDANDAVGRESVTAPIAADVDGFVTVYVDSRELAVGRYRLRVQPSGVEGEASASDFRLSVRASDGA